MSLSCTLILTFTLECVELQGETLAFHFICCIFCLIGWGGWVFGSRRTYRHRSIYMDWHCWCHTVCLCVSQWADLLDLPLWRLTWLACLAKEDEDSKHVWPRKMRILKADITWARWREFNINYIVVALPRPPRSPEVFYYYFYPCKYIIVFEPCRLEWFNVLFWSCKLWGTITSRYR